MHINQILYSMPTWTRSFGCDFLLYGFDHLRLETFLIDFIHKNYCNYLIVSSISPSMVTNASLPYFSSEMSSIWADFKETCFVDAFSFHFAKISFISLYLVLHFLWFMVSSNFYRKCSLTSTRPIGPIFLFVFLHGWHTSFALISTSTYTSLFSSLVQVYVGKLDITRIELQRWPHGFYFNNLPIFISMAWAAMTAQSCCIFKFHWTMNWHNSNRFLSLM